MGINLKFVLLLMAVKTEYVFFRMAAPVTNGLITGESVDSATPAVDVEATAKTSEASMNKPQGVTCHQALQKK